MLAVVAFVTLSLLSLLLCGSVVELTRLDEVEDRLTWVLGRGGEDDVL